MGLTDRIAQVEYKDMYRYMGQSDCTDQCCQTDLSDCTDLYFRIDLSVRTGSADSSAADSLVADMSAAEQAADMWAVRAVQAEC